MTRHGGVSSADGIHRQTQTSGAECVGEWIAPMRAEHREQKAAILTTTSRVEYTCGQAQLRGRPGGPETSSLSVGIPHF
jgi:hypothetical protein